MVAFAEQVNDMTEARVYRLQVGGASLLPAATTKGQAPELDPDSSYMVDDC